MELLINLLILFVIIFTVFKRLQQVAKKQEEIKTQPSSHPGPVTEIKPLSEVIKELSHKLEHREEWIEMKEPTGEPVLLEEGQFEEIQPEFVEPSTSQIPEMVPEAPFLLKPEEPAEEILQPPKSRKVAVRKKEILAYSLRFGGPEVVKGIIMSEILGPPVSIRRDK